MENKTKLTEEQKLRLINGIFEEFEDDEIKFNVRAQIILNSIDKQLKKQFLEKYFAKNKIWFREVPEDLFVALINNSYKTYVDQSLIVTALNNPKVLKNLVKEPDVLNFCVVNKMMCDIDSLRETDDGLHNFRKNINTVLPQIASLVDCFDVFTQARLFNSGAFSKEEIIDNCIFFARKHLVGGKSQDEQSRAVAKDAIIELCVQFDKGNKEVNKRYSRWFFDFVRNELPRQEFEYVLREHDIAYHTEYFQFASAHEILDEYEKIRMDVLKSRCDLQVSREDIAHLLPRVRQVVYDFAYPQDLLPFAKHDKEYFNLYIDAICCPNREDWKERGEWVVGDMMSLAKRFENAEAMEKVYQWYAPKTYHNMKQISNIIKCDPARTAGWLKKSSFYNVYMLESVEDVYGLLHQICVNCKDDSSDVLNELTTRSCLKFALMASIMSNDEELISGVLEELKTQPKEYCKLPVLCDKLSEEIFCDLGEQRALVACGKGDIATQELVTRLERAQMLTKQVYQQVSENIKQQEEAEKEEVLSIDELLAFVK